jgi:hypothetical protein
MLCAHTDNQLSASNVAGMTRADNDDGGSDSFQAGIEEWRA